MRELEINRRHQLRTEATHLLRAAIARRPRVAPPEAAGWNASAWANAKIGALTTAPTVPDQLASDQYGASAHAPTPAPAEEGDSPTSQMTSPVGLTDLRSMALTVGHSVPHVAVRGTQFLPSRRAPSLCSLPSSCVTMFSSLSALRREGAEQHVQTVVIWLRDCFRPSRAGNASLASVLFHKDLVESVLLYTAVFLSVMTGLAVREATG